MKHKAVKNKKKKKDLLSLSYSLSTAMTLLVQLPNPLVSLYGHTLWFECGENGREIPVELIGSLKDVDENTVLDH